MTAPLRSMSCHGAPGPIRSSSLPSLSQSFVKQFDLLYRRKDVFCAESIALSVLVPILSQRHQPRHWSPIAPAPFPDRHACGRSLYHSGVPVSSGCRYLSAAGYSSPADLSVGHPSATSFHDVGAFGTPTAAGCLVLCPVDRLLAGPNLHSFPGGGAGETGTRRTGS